MKRGIILLLCLALALSLYACRRGETNEGHIQILSCGQRFEPYTDVYTSYQRQKGDMVTTVYLPLEPEILKETGKLPSIPYSNDFAVEFTGGGRLESVLLYDADFQRIDAQANLDSFDTLLPGIYYVSAFITEDGSWQEYTVYQCVFELVVA